MKTLHLALSPRDIGTVIRCLMDAENRANMMARHGGLGADDLRRRAKQIREIRQDIANQRKAQS